MGATGSVGSQTIDILARHSENFLLSGVSIHNNVEKLVSLLSPMPTHLLPEWIAISSEQCQTATLQDFYTSKGKRCKILQGTKALTDLVDATKPDLFVASIVGSAGLPSLIKALSMGIDVALANKEALVMGGELVKKLCQMHGSRLLPVDSEHSALFHLIHGHGRENIKNIILTASGGSFRDLSISELKFVTPEQALRHPTWAMGPKITIDSATLINKGLEVIEAHFLFDQPYQGIQVVVHKESIIHAMVEFFNGLIYAEVSPPSMLFPIQSALFWPEISRDFLASIDFQKFFQLSFMPVDHGKYPGLKLCYQAGEAGANAVIVLNAANEVAVNTFLNGKIPFTGICEIIDRTLQSIARQNVSTLEDILYFDSMARERAVAFTGEYV